MTITLKNPLPVLELALMHPGAMCLLLVVVAVIALVVWPAIWSRRGTRRCAAADVLDRVLLTVERVAEVLRSIIQTTGGDPAAP